MDILDRKGAPYARGFATTSDKVVLGYSYELLYNAPSHPERARLLRIVPQQNGIAGHLDHFAAGVDEPLTISFHIEEGPPGAYIAGIKSLTLGWDVFHSGEDITDPDAAVTTRPIEYAFSGVYWWQALRAARDSTPIAFEADLSVFTGYEGQEQVFETFPLKGEVRFTSIEGIPVLLFMLDRYFSLPPGPMATFKPGEGGSYGRAGGPTTPWRPLAQLMRPTNGLNGIGESLQICTLDYGRQTN